MKKMCLQFLPLALIIVLYNHKTVDPFLTLLELLTPRGWDFFIIIIVIYLYDR